MSEPYIKQVRVQDFGCVKDATLELTRLHALIGPNDSGKTTLLRAVRTALQFAGGTFYGNHAPSKLQPFDPGVREKHPFGVDLLISTDEPQWDVRYSVGATRGPNDFRELLTQGEQTLADSQRGSWNTASVVAGLVPGRGERDPIAMLLRLPQWLHLDADAMRQESTLFTEAEEKKIDPSGARLPAIYDAILNRGDDTFLNISKEIQALFPAIKNIRLKNIAANTKEFELELGTGQRVPASFVSDGVLYYLAFAALEHLSPVSMVLIEEPENGLHPSRIADVMKVLRRISERVQVVMATHSPFVINELQGDEVTVVTRPDGQGTSVRRLCDTPNFAERSKVYALGELWVSYADGKHEAPLLTEVEGGS